MAASKKKLVSQNANESVQPEPLVIQDVNATENIDNFTEEKMALAQVEQPAKTMPNWEDLRRAIHAANWDTTLYDNDLDKVWQIAVQGGPSAVMGISWLGHRHLYADLVSSFLKS